MLLKDLTALDGTIKKGVPDPASDAYSSYCKVRAVYGRVEPLSVLTRITTVTHQLGKVSVLKSHNVSPFFSVCSIIVLTYINILLNGRYTWSPDKRMKQNIFCRAVTLGVQIKR